jgi:glycosyltransferase involved in cell wall biosynthesis
MVKILQVIPYFTPQKGGDVNVCYNISKQLAKIGHEVTIITTDFELDKEYANSIEKHGVKVLPFHCIADISLFLISPSMKKWFQNNIKYFDIVHLHDFRSYQNNVATYYSSKYKIPYVIQPHASTPRNISKKTLKWLYDIFYGYRIIKNAHKIIAVSKEEAIYDKQWGGKENRIEVIYNGMDVDSFLKPPKAGNFKKKHGIDNKLILYLGRVNALKGLDNLVKAFAELIKVYDDYYLVIAGPDDGYQACLVSLIRNLGISDKVKFTGFLNEQDKLSALVDADVFVHTVKYMGGVGIAPFEAILCNTPVIVSPGCGELIKETDSGYLVKYGDIKELKNQLLYVTNNLNEAHEKVERGRKYIFEHLTWDKVVQKIEQLYYSCIS